MSEPAHIRNRQDAHSSSDDVGDNGTENAAVSTSRIGLLQTSGASKGVFYPAILILLGLVLTAIVLPEQLNAVIAPFSDMIIDSATGYYVLAAAIMVAFVIVVALSGKGDIVLGKDEDEPEHSLGSWFAMLFAAGMGIGLVFYGVAEPLMQYASPQPGTSVEINAHAQSAITTSIFHFGLTAWAIYAVIGLSVGYAVHRRGKSVSLRWALESLLKQHTDGAIGNSIDVVAVVATLIGVATSLGTGVMQLASGVEFLFGISLSKSAVVAVSLFISALAAISVSSGLDRGIKMLSNANLILAAIFTVLVALLGPTLFLTNGFVQNIGDYICSFVPMSFQTIPFAGKLGADWMGTWTVYYWAWWISWSPFVGIFIARISRGRTVREFVMGTVLVPTLVTIIWFSVMGGTALYQQMFGAGNLVASDGTVDATMALFQMLANLPGTKILSGAAIIMLVVFFVTSSDSGSYVMSMLSTGGNSTPPMSVRLTWAVLTGAVTASLLAAGGEGLEGITALQTLVLLVALPMSILMLVTCVALWRDLGAEQRRMAIRQRRLMRSRIVDEAVQAAVDQIDESVRSQTPVRPIELPYPLWSSSYLRRAGVKPPPRNRNK